MRRANERRSDTAMRGEDLVDFGEIPPAVNEILQEGVALHRHDRVAADAARAVTSAQVLRADLARDPSFQARFSREAQNAASLNHPAIVAV